MLLFLVITSLATAQLAMSMYTPSMPAMVTALHTSGQLVRLSLPIFFFSLGGSQLAYGPLSDYVGRRKAMLLGIGYFILGSILCVSALDIQLFLVGRFVEGLGIGCALTVGRAIIRDSFAAKHLYYANICTMMAVTVVPVIAPFVGAYIATLYGWRGNFAAMILVAGIILFFYLRFFKETNIHLSYKRFSFLRLRNEYKDICKNRAFLCYTLSGAMLFGIVGSFIAVGPFLFISELGLSPMRYGAMVIIIVAGYFVGSISELLFHRYIDTRRSYQISFFLLLASSLLLVILSIIFKLQAYSMMICLFIAMIGIGVLIPRTLTDALHQFKAQQNVGGAAAAFYGFCQMIFAAIISAIVGAAAATNQIPLATAILICSVLSFTAYFFRE